MKQGLIAVKLKLSWTGKCSALVRISRTLEDWTVIVLLVVIEEVSPVLCMKSGRNPRGWY